MQASFDRVIQSGEPWLEKKGEANSKNWRVLLQHSLGHNNAAVSFADREL